jgi:hypothetical protein
LSRDFNVIENRISRHKRLNKQKGRQPGIHSRASSCGKVCKTDKFDFLFHRKYYTAFTVCLLE